LEAPPSKPPLKGFHPLSIPTGKWLYKGVFHVSFAAFLKEKKRERKGSALVKLF
jgi:hypothetical protein